MRNLLTLLALCCLAHVSLAAPMITYTNPGPTCSVGDRVINNVTINDFTGVPVAGALVPRIYYRKAAGTWFSQAGTLTAGNGLFGIWSFTIVAADLAPLVLNDVVQFYIIAQSTNVTPQISSSPAGVVATNVNTITTHPASPNSYLVSQALNGSYTVGSGGNFTTLASAIATYNNACLEGPVVFNLTDASYTVNSQLTIDQNAYASAAHSLTIRPAAGVTTTINGNTPLQLFNILGSFITIDGNNGVSDRQLTIINNSAGSPRVFGIFSTGFAVTSDITIQNTILVNGLNSFYAIYIADKVTPAAIGYFRNIRIRNNSIQKALIGISAYMSTGAGFGTGVEITDNDLTATGANAIRNTGIYIKGSDGAIIRNNRIGNFDGDNDEDDIAIWLDNGARNTVVEKNKIDNIGYNGNAGWGGVGIYVSSGIAAANITLANNFISNLRGDGRDYEAVPTGNPVGILLLSSQDGINVMHNSIYLSGNMLRFTRSLAMGIYVGNGTLASITNNIIVNNIGFKAGVANDVFAPIGSAAIVAGSSSQFTSIQNNDYWVANTGFGSKDIGRIGATGYNTIAGWQAASGETHAKNILPVFTSGNDLHIIPASNSSLDNAGITTSVTVDIDNETRSASTPDVGADEFTSPCIAPAITTPPVVTTICTGAAASFSVEATGTGLLYQWRKNTIPILNATDATFTLAATVAADAGNYDVVVTGSCGTVTSTPVALVLNTPPAISTQPVVQVICPNATANFSVTATGSNLIYQWRKNGTPIPTAINNTFTIATATITDEGNYDVVISGSCTPPVISSAVALSVIAAPAITTQPIAQTACSGGNISFTIVATGNALTYQWRKNTTPIATAITNTLALSGVSAVDEASYDVVVTSSCGVSVTSNPVTFTLKAATVIGTQPISQAICLGSPVTFTVAATGSGLSYQWTKNTIPIAGAITNAFTITNVTAADAGNYAVNVTGCTPVTSAIAVLTLPTINTWLGTVSNQWNNAANWCLGIPTAGTDAVIAAGTPFSPVVDNISDCRDLTINTSASVTINASGRLNLHGNFINNGTMNAASGTIAMQGTTLQNIPALTTANLIMNGAGGINLGGNLTVNNTLTLTNGNITVNATTVVLNSSATGTVLSHIITNNTGSVTSNNIAVTAVTIPVGPTAASYNPVTIAAGGSRNYTVSVAAGVTPSLLDNNRAINCTWKINPSTAGATNVTINLQYADADANSACNPASVMEAGVHDGTNWNIISGSGLTPTGTAAARQVTLQASVFGNMAIANPGGFTYPTSTPTLDPDVTSMQLLPNLITNDNAVLRIQSRAAMKINFVVTDLQGRTVMQFSKQVLTGRNDLPVTLKGLSNGIYHIQGTTNKGLVDVIRMLRM